MMKLAVICLGLLSWFVSRPVALIPVQSKVTLHSVNKHRAQQQTSCINFSTPLAELPGPCDLRYGSLYVNNDLDWFESSGEIGHRSVIKDLGMKSWDQEVTVLVVEPLPKLKAGERRLVTIDVSGADGADGAPGAPGKDGDGVVRSSSTDHKRMTTVFRAAPPKPKHDGKPRIDPMFVKAIVGHMYVIHVVDDLRDFYALFRVEAIERGDNCTISWQLIQAPNAQASRAQR